MLFAERKEEGILSLIKELFLPPTFRYSVFKRIVYNAFLNFKHG